MTGLITEGGGTDRMNTGDATDRIYVTDIHNGSIDRGQTVLIRVLARLRRLGFRVSPCGAGVPSINTNEMQTNVLVGNGQTLVLGGILQEDENYARRKTPIFGDLPVVGRLFRRKIKRKDQQELLVFITPTLVPDSPALANLKAEALAVPE